ncbi:hypothetical protein [Lactiplantibacillus daowaiensis]|uniref:DUF4365 domain-containing protein n=1 Tax=Lactiplantibacillus daowaiensis TaxID=2559918 RepID=A0ABW1RZX3_9LACO|nr:hypothetical protein [Lactiplantibacillus daowaiensis]
MTAQIKFQQRSRELVCENDNKKTEIYNQVKLQAALIDFGLVMVPLAYDSAGADFLLTDFEGNQMIKVQLKARITVSKKYAGKHLYMAFPMDSKQPDRDWVIVAHDELAELWGKTETTDYLANGGYTAKTVPQQLQAKIQARSVLDHVIQL